MLFFVYLFSLRYTKGDTSYNYTYTIIILYLYHTYTKILQVCLIYTLYLTGLKNIHKVPKSSFNEVLLTTFHKQEQKPLGFWVFFVVLQWVLQLSLKQMMGQVLENLGTNVWNRFDQSSLDNPLVHLFLRVLWQMCLNVLDLNLSSFALHHLLNRQCCNWVR